jgi:HlyD family secretion protein
MAPVTKGTIARTVSATGTVSSVLTIIVGSYVSGVIREVSCDYNTQVVPGQICARIDLRPYRTMVDKNKANLSVANAQLRKGPCRSEVRRDSLTSAMPGLLKQMRCPRTQRI